ncbi:MAG: hypothetical protein AB3N33_05090 [Puniceicoccaceae bacterium]
MLLGVRKHNFSLVLFLFLAGMGPVTLGQPLNPPANLPDPPPLPPSLEGRPMQPPPELPDFSELQEQLRQLQELLSMPPEKLQKLRQTIEFIEKMSPSERDAMHIRLSQITQATPELKEEINHLAKQLPGKMQSSLSQFWYASSPEDRAIIRAELEKLPPEEGSAFLAEKVAAFIQHRDEVFTQMRQSLERRRNSKLSSPNP